MNFLRDENHYILRLMKDEDLFPTLEQWAIDENLTFGALTGIGALKDIELGFYHLDKKEYERKVFPEETELLGLTGNLSLFNNRPFFHLHSIHGASDFSTFGGHLFSAKVAVTVEIHFHSLKGEVHREMDSEIGLNLLNLCQAPHG